MANQAVNDRVDDPLPAVFWVSLSPNIPFNKKGKVKSRPTCVLHRLPNHSSSEMNYLMPPEMWNLSELPRIEKERKILQIEDFKCKIWIMTQFCPPFSKVHIFKYKIFPNGQKKWLFSGKKDAGELRYSQYWYFHQPEIPLEAFLINGEYILNTEDPFNNNTCSHYILILLIWAFLSLETTYVMNT